MELRERHLGPITTRSDGGSEVRVDAGALVRRLLLFEHCTLESDGLVSGIIERVKDLAADDGKTVSSWIRDVVEREVLCRERSKTVGVVPTVQWKERTLEPLSSTLSSGEQNVEELRKLVG